MFVKTNCSALCSVEFLGVFVKQLPRAITGFIMSVRMKKFDSHWTDYCGIIYLGFLLKYADKIKVI